MYGSGSGDKYNDCSYTGGDGGCGGGVIIIQSSLLTVYGRIKADGGSGVFIYHISLIQL